MTQEEKVILQMVANGSMVVIQIVLFCYLFKNRTKRTPSQSCETKYPVKTRLKLIIWFKIPRFLRKKLMDTWVDRWTSSF